MQNLKIGVAQMTSRDDFAQNLSTVTRLYESACEQGAGLVLFPENTLFFRIRSGSAIQGFEWEQLKTLGHAVDKSGAALLLSTPVKTADGKFTNSTVFIEPGLAPRIVYSKVHLFDVDVQGAPPVRESDYFLNGEGPRVLEYCGWKIGLSICYDLRFAELYLAYAQKVDLILVPSAFLVPTGEAHWHTLLRARAIEAQAYVAAPAQSGEHKSGDQVRKTYGHSLVVDPWGRVMADLNGGEGVTVVELSPEAITKVRKQIPMNAHRRLVLS